MSGATTAEGDQARQNAAKRAADLELRIAELEEEVRKSEERAASLRKDASNLRERHDAMGGALEAADLEGKNAMSVARRIPLSLADAKSMTESELIQAMLEARINDGDYSADAERNKALADYFKARDEIRERAGRERA